MKFIEYLVESTSSKNALESYIKDASKKYMLVGHEKELLHLYGNEKPLKLYRGLNFDTKEDYDKFISTIKNGYIKISNDVSSWTRDKRTAKQFAVTKPSYMEFMSSDKMKLIDDSKKNKEYVVGYRGMILEIKIDKGVGVDTSKSGIEAEDEIILFDGTYKCTYTEVKKNSDLIKEIGVRAILNDIEKNKSDIEYNNTMISKIIKDHRSDIDDDMRTFFGKRFLSTPPHFDYEIVSAFNKDRDLIKQIVIEFSQSPLEIYGNDLFNKDDIDKFVSNSKTVHLKKMKEIESKINEVDEVITTGSPGKWFKLIGLDSRYKKLTSSHSKKYNKLNSDENIKSINSLKGKDKHKAIDDFAKNLEDLLRKMSVS